MKQVEVKTFGCRLNAFESEVIRQQTKFASISDDAVVINTCAVTAEAERQARQAIRRARREKPNARIVVTGCAAQINPDAYSTMPEVDLVIGNSEKFRITDLLSEQKNSIVVNDIMSLQDTAPQMVSGFDGRARAFIQVQNGCDHRCTFCIIPFGRGNSRSVPINQIVEQTRILTSAGYKEVVLTGVDISAYGHDLKGAPNLGHMIATLLREVSELDRLRISSIDPAEIDSNLKNIISSEARFMPHIHLSIQSGDDVILKRMKRRHDRETVINICEELRLLRPDIVLGADLIAGFPTETEKMFSNTLNLIQEIGLVWLHVFPYSLRRGTPAARMPQLPGNIIRERAQKLRRAGETTAEDFLESQLNKIQLVLMEKTNRGLSQHYSPVRLLEDSGQIGEVLKVIARERSGGHLIAEAIK